MAETLLVTGGAGFIGCNFVRLVLAETDARLLVLDKLTYAGSLENLAGVLDDPRLTFVQGDIADRPTVQRLYLEFRPTAVVNFAAESHVDRSIDDPSDFVCTNVVGTFELLEGARLLLAAAPSAERENFRLLHVSTDEVYGSLGSKGAFKETTPYAPNSPYAASKASADHLVRAYHKTYGLPILLTNCSNNYGPYQFPEKLIPLMVLNAIEGRPLPIYGDGGNVRDWIYVEDHCRGILEVLRRGNAGEKYNLGGRSQRTNLQVVDAICEILESELPAKDNAALVTRGFPTYQSLKESVPNRPGHDWRYAINSGKIRRELGWRPRHTFTSGLRTTVRWYLENQAWAEAVQVGKHARTRRGEPRQ
jgi:dTDP-glucose 4,6-dehydratase